MERCLVCHKSLREYEEICDSCFEFFEWKYKDDPHKAICRFLDHLEKTSSPDSTKLQEVKKCQKKKVS